MYKLQRRHIIILVANDARLHGPNADLIKLIWNVCMIQHEANVFTQYVYIGPMPVQ